MAQSTPLISSRYPYLEVSFSAGHFQATVSAYIDTGFDGFLAVPLAVGDQIGAEDGWRPWRLADGSLVWAPFYRATLRIGSFSALRASVMALGNEHILGRGIIDRFAVTFDRGRRVLVEP